MTNPQQRFSPRALWPIVPIMLATVGICVARSPIASLSVFIVIGLWALACLGIENTENW